MTLDIRFPKSTLAGPKKPDVHMNPVETLYQKYLSEGLTKKDAAKLAQKETGLALVTGKPIKSGQFLYGKHTRDGQTGLTIS